MFILFKKKKHSNINSKLIVYYSYWFQVTVTVDNVFSEQGSTAGAFTFLTTSRAYIGGSENPRDLPGSTVHSSFVGCLRRVSKTSLSFFLSKVPFLSRFSFSHEQLNWKDFLLFWFVINGLRVFYHEFDFAYFAQCRYIDTHVYFEAQTKERVHNRNCLIRMYYLYARLVFIISMQCAISFSLVEDSNTFIWNTYHQIYTYYQYK